MSQDSTMQGNQLHILIWPDDKLTQPSEPVTEFNQELEQLCLDLFTTMKMAGGIGLSAPQCGIHKQVITLWIEKHNPLVLINPQIVEVGEQTYQWEEGCLSVPGYFDKRERPKLVVIKYQDIKGEFHEVEFRDLYAFAAQHEIDHLEGKTFVDGAPLLTKQLIKFKVSEFLKNLIKKNL